VFQVGLPHRVRTGPSAQTHCARNALTHAGQQPKSTTGRGSWYHSGCDVADVLDLTARGEPDIRLGCLACGAIAIEPACVALQESLRNAICRVDNARNSRLCAARW